MHQTPSSLSLPRPVALVGLPGSGKSAIGRRLAQRLRVPFVDADQRIEEAAGMSIPEIFERWGEAFFRDRERQVIGRLLRDPPHVLATGGGAFANEETRSLIRETAISLWLDADLELLLARTGRRNNRPLLRQGDPREILSRLMAERVPHYREADIHIESRDVPPDETVGRALAALAAHLEGPDPEAGTPAP
jgi:shikimate kinase